MAIKHGEVEVIRDEDGMAIDYVPTKNSQHTETITKKPMQWLTGF